MNPMLKYTLARIGLFVVVAAVLLAIPFELNLFLKLGIAVLVSALLALFLLRGMRDELAAQLAGAAERRAAEKARLRDALAGDEDEPATSGDTTANTAETVDETRADRDETTTDRDETTTSKDETTTSKDETTKAGNAATRDDDKQPGKASDAS